MNKTIKSLMILVLSVLMFFGMAMTPVSAKPGRGRKPTPTPTDPPTVTPTPDNNEEPETEVAEGEDSNETEAPIVEEAPIEEAVVEEAIVEEAVVEEAVVEEAPIEETSAEEVPVEETSIEEAPAEGFAVYLAEPGSQEGDFDEGPSLRSVGQTPAHTKTITDNQDGTYTLSLDVVGDSEKKPNNVNVIVIFDTSGSMSQQRMTAAKNAVNNLATALYAYNTASAPDTVEMALVRFATSSSIAQQPTNSGTTFRNSVNGLGNQGNGGTNWEAALQTARNVSFGDDDQTFVIFVSDGNPTFRTSQNGWNDWSNTYQQWGTGQETSQNISRCYTTAVDDAQALATSVGVNNFFTIGAFGSVDRMQQLTTDAGAPIANYYSAQDTAALNQAISDILAKIEMVGIGNASIEDGTTNQVTTTSGAIAELLEVDTSSFKYYRSGGAYGTGTEWADAPKATFNNGKVDWDLSEVGVLENGVKYTVKFDVYPSQFTYDTIAQLKNGDITYASLDTEIKKYIVDNGDGSYSLRTNTEAMLSYDDTRDEAGQQEVGYTNPDPVGTDADTLTINKKWEGANPDVQTLDITVLMGDEEFHTATIGSSNNWSTNAYISLGIIKNGTALPGALGHDFSFAELGDEQYRWELDAPTVRPMLVNGAKTMLVKVDGKHPAPSGATTYTIAGATYYVDSAAGGLTATNIRRSYLDVKKVVVSDGPKDPNAEDVAFDFIMKVVNSRASADGSGSLSSDDYVWFSVKDSNNAFVIDDGLVSGDVVRETEDGEYTGYYYMRSGTEIHVNMKDGYSLRFLNLPSGSTYEVAESATMPNKDYSFVEITGGTVDSGNPQKVTGTIEKANDPKTVTVTNKFTPCFYVYHSSDNTIEKIKMNDTRVRFDESSNTYKFNIVEETKENYLYGGYFSAYSDAGMTDEAIVAADYSLTDNKNYTYNKVADPERVAWAKDSAGTAYTGEKVNVWKAKNAYTESKGGKGTEVKPEPGTVYYLKEVPEAYFTPGIYYIYDTRDPEKHIKKLYLMIPMDDGIYTSYGSVNNSPATTTNKMYASYKVTKYDGSIDIKKAQDINTDVPRGYLAVWDVKGLIQNGKSYEWTPSFVTKDNITVTSIQRRKIVIGNGCFDAATSRKYTADEDTSGVQAFYVVDYEEDSTYSAN